MSENELKTYKGCCHCGAYQISVEMPEIKSVKECNCSLCVKKGYLWSLVSAKAITHLKGGDDLVEYQFGKKTRTHKFCGTCGTSLLLEQNDPEAKDTIALNARILIDVNPFSLKLEKFDGKGMWGPAYIPIPFTGELPTAEIYGSKVYTGSCHCGGVTLAVKTKPLTEIEIKEDNCSICQRNANACIYPHQSQVSIVGNENCTEYAFGKKFNGHLFCKTCGVQVYMKVHGPPASFFEGWTDARKAAVKGRFEILPVRVRVLDNIDLDELKIVRSDEGTEGYEISWADEKDE